MLQDRPVHAHHRSIVIDMIDTAVNNAVIDTFIFFQIHDLGNIGPAVGRKESSHFNGQICRICDTAQFFMNILHWSQCIAVIFFIEH